MAPNEAAPSPATAAEPIPSSAPAPVPASPSAAEDDQPNPRALRKGFRPASLDAVNFLLSDVRGALGPYLNVFLVTQQKWSQSEVGLVTTIGVFWASRRRCRSAC